MPIKYWRALLLSAFALFSNAQADSQNIIPGKTDQVSTSQTTNTSTSTSSSAEQHMFSLSGFGSLGVMHSNQTAGDYVTESYLPSGAGRSNEWDTTNYNKLAAQIIATFSPKVTGQFQVITAFESDGTFAPDIEWLNVKYTFSQNAYVRAGRIGWPTFFDSGNHDVGYTYPWAHPPSELYYLMPIQSGDGIDAMYRYGIGEARNSIKIVTGRNTINSKTVASSSKTMWGIFDTVEYGDTIIHAGYQKRNTSNQYMQTMTADEETEFSDLSLGVSYDTGDWFLMSEWIQSRSSYKANAMYIAAGYRIGKYTPYLIHSQITSGSFTPESMPSSLQLALAKRSQSTDSIGLRWDFKNNIDLKLQYDSVKLSENSNGFLVNVPSNQSLYGSTFNLFSAVVDFLF